MIAIIAILAVVVVLTLNPAEMMREARDSNRLSDLSTLTSALGTYEAQGGNALGISGIIYVSLPDPTLTGSATSTCSSLGLPLLPAGYTYQCASPEDYRDANGTGWIPVDFSSLAMSNILSELPVDPTNQTSTDLFYTYVTNGTQYQITAHLESQKYAAEEVNSGGADPALYTTGSNLSLAPFVGGMVGYWPLNEGAGSFAYDLSGGNTTGTWNGNASGTSGYYSPGYNQNWEGYFNGINNYISVGSSTRIEPIQAGTYAAWVDPIANCAPGGYGIVIADESVYYDENGVALLCDDADDISLEIGSVNTSWNAIDTPGYKFTPNTWFFVAGTWDGSNMKLYVNGVLVGSTAQTIVPNPQYSTFIGTDPSNPTQNNPFEGEIADVRIYNRALSAAEIQAIYDAKK